MITVDILKPAHWQDFEALCHSLYRDEFDDPTATPNGRPGQKQHGVDVFVRNGALRVGIQCKRYDKISFVIVEEEIRKAEKGDVKLDLLIIATTADNDAKLTSKVVSLSDRRRAEGKFQVKVTFWDEIQTLLRRHPKTARAFYPSHPGGMLADGMEQLAATDHKQQSGSEEVLKGIADIKAILEMRSSNPAATLPSASPPGLNRLVTAQLDEVRDAIRMGRVRDALRQLQTLEGEKEAFEPYNQFRWHTSYGACQWAQGNEAAAAEQFLEASRYAPEDERALANRARAFLLKKDVSAALRAAEAGLTRHPDSGLIWSVKLNAQQLAGQKVNERSVPARLRRSAEILHILAWGELSGGNPGRAFKLAQKARSSGPDNLEVRRLLLASAAAWSTYDPIRAHLRQITVAQLSAVREGLDSFEPLEETLVAIQDVSARQELANNGAIALTLLGEVSRARAMVEQALASGLISDGLLRLRLIQLDDENRFEEIKALCDPRLDTLSNEILLLALEIASGRHDFDWCGKVRVALEARALNDRQRLELASLNANRLAIERTPNEAVEYILAELAHTPQSVILNCVAAALWRRCDDLPNALASARAAGQLAMKATASHEIHMAAEQLYALGEYASAAPLYERLLTTPGDNAVTYKLIFSHLQLGQRAKAQAVIDRLATKIRRLPQFRRLEARLLQLMGDWPGLRDILQQEVSDFPQAIDVAIGYAATLYRLGDMEALTAFLARDVVFVNASIREQMEFAKYQVHYGDPRSAIQRMYSLFRSNPQDTEAASAYLMILFLAAEQFGMPVHAQVVENTAVELISAGAPRWAVLEGAEYASLPQSNDVLSAQSPRRKALLGKSTGERVVFEAPMGRQEYTIGVIESVFAYASRKAHDMVVAAIEPSGPLFSVRVQKDDGELDVEALHESLKLRSAYVRETFDKYRKSRMPLSMLAALLGVDLVTLWLEWPRQDLEMFVCHGLQEERDEGLALAGRNDRPVVLDLLTLVELIRLELAEQVLTWFGRPLVASATMEQLDFAIQAAAHDRSQGVMQDDEGTLRFIEIPVEYHERRLAFLSSVKKAIERFCDVVPVIGPVELPDGLARLGNVLDSATFNTLLLCAEREATLLSEDGMLRQLAVACGVLHGTWLQPVLMVLRDGALIDQATYSQVVLGKRASRHSFVSFDGRDLLWAAAQSPEQTNAKVRDALKALESPTLLLSSGVTVGLEFVRLLIANKFPWRTIMEYLQFVLLALTRDRARLANHFAGVFWIMLWHMLYLRFFRSGITFPDLPLEERCILLPAYDERFHLRPVALACLHSRIGRYGYLLDGMAEVLLPFFTGSAGEGGEGVAPLESAEPKGLVDGVVDR